MEVERKTVVATSVDASEDSTPKENVLHSYRSFNYLFTLAALSTEEIGRAHV